MSSVGDLFDRTFQSFRARWRALVGIMGSAALALAGLLGAAALAGGASWGPKDYGVLIIGPTGAQAVASLRSGLKGKFPLEFAFGLADAREIQGAIDRLTALRVKRLVVVPLVLFTESSAMEQSQYVFGLRKDPSAEFFGGPHAHSGYTNVRRAQTKLPVVMSSGLDDHPLVAKILADRAKKLSKRPERERVVLLGRGAASDAENEVAARTLNSLARRVREAGRYADAQAFVLRDAADAPKRAAAERQARDAVSALSRTGSVLVVAHMLVPDGFERSVRKLLEGRFFAFDAKGLMPDARFAEWVEAKAKEAAVLPDMRRFKDTGHAVPPPDRKKMLRLPGSATFRQPSAPSQPKAAPKEKE